MPAMRACQPRHGAKLLEEEMHFRSFRVVLSAGAVAVAWTLLSVVAALAGDTYPPLPK